MDNEDMANVVCECGAGALYTTIPKICLIFSTDGVIERIALPSVRVCEKLKICC